MTHRIIFSIIFTFFSLAISSQSMTLPMLGLKDTTVEASLKEVSRYISNKPKGLRFPVSKVVFRLAEEGLTYEVEGIDNSWTNMFNYGEVSYGYAIVRNRLFVIMGLAKEEIDLNMIFFHLGETKLFSKEQKPTSGTGKRPKWLFSCKAGVTEPMKVEDLDILDK